ncbi:MAG: DUF6602 domain-containing protein [Chitinophagales bacterium]
MNKRYFEIFKTKVDNFISELRRSKSLYEDLKKKNKLLHSGEYGMFKERTFKELIEFIKPYKIETTDGYVINSYDETSTQCDLILFDKLNTPLIQFGDRYQFIPAESVVAIGEIKSTLSKLDLIETAVKLAKNKALCRPSQEFINLNPGFKNELFVPFSFIICDGITGINKGYSFKDLVIDLAKRYKNEGVDINNYFNIIISLTDKKVFGYRTSKEYKSPNVPIGTKIYYPKRFGDVMNGSIVDCADQYNLMREFAVALTNSLNQRPTYIPDLVDYLWE